MTTGGGGPVRIERDSPGEVSVPADALYGTQTARALVNFTVTGQHAHPRFVEAYVLIKKAAALAKEAVEANRPVLDLALEKGVIDEAERRRVLEELGMQN